MTELARLLNVHSLIGVERGDIYLFAVDGGLLSPAGRTVREFPHTRHDPDFHFRVSAFDVARFLRAVSLDAAMLGFV